jgi:hypothetical protein
LRQLETAGTECCREERDNRKQGGKGDRWMKEHARHQFRA